MAYILILYSIKVPCQLIRDIFIIAYLYALLQYHFPHGPIYIHSFPVLSNIPITTFFKLDFLDARNDIYVPKFAI